MKNLVTIVLFSFLLVGCKQQIQSTDIPNINGYSNGDLLIHINVWTPRTLNKEQKQFFEKALTDNNFIPNPEKGDKSFFEKVKDMFS